MKIPKVFHLGKNLYSKKHVDKAFSQKEVDTTITEWYTVEEIQEKFNMTRIAIYSFVSEKKIPKKKESRTVFYSKEHVDVAKGLKAKVESIYYVYLTTKVYSTNI